MFQRIHLDNPKIIEITVSKLHAGGLVVYPTETCYGVGVDATNTQAVTKLLSYKSRREGKPISIAVSDKEMAERYVEINSVAHNLYDNYVPGPLTVVSKSRGNVVAGIESEYQTLGIRIPDYPIITDIIKTFGKPVTATSANMSYKPRPYSIDDLLNNLPVVHQNKIDLIIDAGTLPRNDVSTVVDTTLQSLNVVREGKVSCDQKGEPVSSTVTTSPRETMHLASTVILRYLSSLKDYVLILALGGELGSGKTQFAKGVARQLGITETIRSPTFSLVHEHPYSIGDTGGMFVHIDTWRLATSNELAQLNLSSYIVPGNVIAIEWADTFLEELRRELITEASLFLNVKFDRINSDKRKIHIERL